LLLELFYGRYPYANPFDRACHSVWREKAVENFVAKVKPAAVSDVRLFDSLVAKCLLGDAGLQQAFDLLRCVTDKNLNA
jgi:hypothetical protein